MDLTGFPIPRMDWDSTNIVEEFKKFHQHVELILTGALSEKTEAVNVTYLLLWVGEKGREIYNTLTLSDDERKSARLICDAFQKHLQPKSNSIFSRFINSTIKSKIMTVLKRS